MYDQCECRIDEVGHTVGWCVFHHFENIVPMRHIHGLMLMKLMRKMTGFGIIFRSATLMMPTIASGHSM